jgi:TonB family protein
VQSATKQRESATPEPAGQRSPAPAKKAKLAVLLITRDDMLWPQIGGHLGNDLILKQVDSIDELISATPAGEPAIVLWDARNQSDITAVFSRLQLHSPRFAVIALDEADNGNAWTNPIALRQVVAHLAVPVPADGLKSAIGSAQEEVNARMALLGDGSAAAASTPSGSRKIPWAAVAAAAAVIACVGAGIYWFSRPSPAPAKTAAAAATTTVSPAAAVQPAGKAPVSADDKIDLLIEKAQQAMLDRHFIDPADGSALSLYRNALLLDPNNGEAKEGLQRLAEILFARVQSALDERKFDVALQAVETARSINPNDSRLSALDERIASLRAEFGPTQILAAINAQNFDRASQLIDEAARSKSLSNAKLAQLREELRRRHEDADVANWVKLIDSRLQQDKLIEPRNDSAAFYLGQARAAGASVATLQPQTQEIYKRLAQMVHTDIDQRHFADADRLLADMHNYGLPATGLASLQHDLNAARTSQAATTSDHPQYLELAQSRLTQGKVTEPDNDSALYYVNQLRATDPSNSGLARMSSAVQAAILDQARAALDANQPAKAESLLQTAAGLGASADLAPLNQRLAQMKAASDGPPLVTEASLTRVRGIELDYPDEALRKGVEGWVDLSFQVTADGKVTKVMVLDSSPPKVFDGAASRALSRMRYKPVLQGGKPIVVNAKLRIAFHLQK